ncbi:MAG TPA: amino acid ABC transporter permease, partial [Candidatus Halomonas stercoripullorum]|nr:amino acid ABC transporter permease [Candidatus Halomonas stercoripullorum]
MSVRPKAHTTGPKPPFWRDRAKRALIFQALLIVAVAVFLLIIIGNTQANLSARGITTGFGFLTN